MLFHSVQTGFAYPLYYNTLFAALREEFNLAIASAKQNRLGYWPQDKALDGVTVQNGDDLAIIPPIWPKLWRRLNEFFQNANSLAGFIDYLEQRCGAVRHPVYYGRAWVARRDRGERRQSTND